MRNRLIMAAVAAAALVPLAATAGPSYTYVEGGYRNVDGDLDGFFAGGSIAVMPQLHVMGDFSRITDSPIRADQLRALVGFNHAFTPNTDLVLRGGWTQIRDRSSFDDVTDADLATLRDSGFVAEAGVRAMLTDGIELNGFVKHQDIEARDTSLAVGGVFGFTPALGVTGNVEFFDDDTVYEVGLRFSFGAPRTTLRR
jgi:hypothetical protein